MVRYARRKFIGMKRTASAKKNSKSNGSSRVKAKADLVVCVKNRGYAASLELRKIYRTFADRDARQHGYLRVLDESGEDYLYPADFFLPLNLPRSTERAVLMAG